mmetsp:Transcript_120798/g.327798  ORF Transcript_120798/g.327798 Transcript_120798/m.327798 type:complete len:502 (+) Transcript_120798:1067-2572(+)
MVRLPGLDRIDVTSVLVVCLLDFVQLLRVLVERIAHLLLQISKALLNRPVASLGVAHVLRVRALELPVGLHLGRQPRVLVGRIADLLLQEGHPLRDGGMLLVLLVQILVLLVQLLQHLAMLVGGLPELLLQEAHALRQRGVVLLVRRPEAVVAPLEVGQRPGVPVRGVPELLLDEGDPLRQGCVDRPVVLHVLHMPVVSPLHVGQSLLVLIGRIPNDFFYVLNPLFERCVMTVCALHGRELLSVLVVGPLELCKHPGVLVGGVAKLLLEERDALGDAGVMGRVGILQLAELPGVPVVGPAQIGAHPFVLLCRVPERLLHERHALLHARVVPPDVAHVRRVGTLQLLQRLHVLLEGVAHVPLQVGDAVDELRATFAHGREADELLQLSDGLLQPVHVPAEDRNLLFVEAHLCRVVLGLHHLDRLDVGGAAAHARDGHRRGGEAARAGAARRRAHPTSPPSRGVLGPGDDAVPVGVQLVEEAGEVRHGCGASAWQNGAAPSQV